MWDERKRRRLRTLKEAADSGTLTKAERAELAALGQDPEAAEAEYLRPTTERLHRERRRVERQNEALRAVLARKDALVERLRGVLK